jgi:pimeloyl-ACP methyl ester carboxylesterase
MLAIMSEARWAGRVSDQKLLPDYRFEVMEEEAHQPFQEVPDQWNARVDAFWREVEEQGGRFH